MKTSPISIYWAAGIAIIGGFLQSYVACVIAGALSFIVQEFQLGPLEEGWIASAILLGALVGSVFCGYLADKLGRRVSLQLSALLFFFTGISVFFAGSFSSLLLIRFLSGFAAGMTSLLVPLYLGEIAPASTRGAFVTAFTLAVTAGTLIAYLANYALASSGNWRLMLSLGALPAALQFVAFFFLPQGKVEKAVLSKWSNLLSPSVRFVLLIGIGLSVFQQLSGINAVIYFTPKIFKEAGFIGEKQALLPTLLIGIINVISTFISMFLIDRSGRKKLFLISQFGVILALLFIAFGFATKNVHLDYLAVIALVAYVGFYALGMGPIIWVIIAEIYPLSIRAKAIAVMTFLSWLSNYSVVFTFPPFLAKTGSAFPFFTYAFLSVCAFFLFLRYLPETKGKTLEELEKMLVKKSG